MLILPELLLQGSDLGLFGGPQWRGLAYGFGSFWPDLLAGGKPAFALQPVTMFLTYGLLHADLWHLLGNLLALIVLGEQVIRRAGPAFFFRICLVSALTAALAFALINPEGGPMVGASGMAFGLAGALAVRRPGQIARVVLELVLLNAGLWLLLSGALAWEAHLGGFLGGLALAWPGGRGPTGRHGAGISDM